MTRALHGDTLSLTNFSSINSYSLTLSSFNYAGVIMYNEMNMRDVPRTKSIENSISLLGGILGSGNSCTIATSLNHNSWTLVSITCLNKLSTFFS